MGGPARGVCKESARQGWTGCGPGWTACLAVPFLRRASFALALCWYCLSRGSRGLPALRWLPLQREASPTAL